MVSLAAFEVNLIMIPLLGVLCLQLFPFRPTRAVVNRIVSKIESFNASGVTLLAILAIFTGFLFAMELYNWESKYDHPKERAVDMAILLRNENKRLRSERNMYIHLICSILCSSVRYITHLYMRPAEKAAAESAQKDAKKDK